MTRASLNRMSKETSLRVTFEQKPEVSILLVMRPLIFS